MLKCLDHLEEWLIAGLMGAATLITFVAVLHRYGSGIAALQPYLAHINLSWAQELTIYLFVWMAKFGAAYGVRTGIHVGVDVLINRLPDKTRARFIVFGLLAGALFTGAVAVMGGDFVWNIAHTDQTSPDLEAPMWLVYLAIPAGSTLMCFRFLQVAWNFVHTGSLPKHDHSHVEGVDGDQALDNLHPHDMKHGGRP
ncbi:C4-dicarboxylate ABC transporter permease [Xenophilus sp. AP218F]|nr:TRAP transporter small permease [Chromobacterium sp. ASV5]OWY37722.1 C4-dicarboxylate ABC transporter permease [Xenophilus sp. AP218F]